MKISIQLLDRTENLPGFSKHIFKYWVKILDQPEFNKATQHRLEAVV
jgi:hypothetical protein